MVLITERPPPQLAKFTKGSVSVLLLLEQLPSFLVPLGEKPRVAVTPSMHEQGGRAHRTPGPSHP